MTHTLPAIVYNVVPHLAPQAEAAICLGLFPPKTVTDLLIAYSHLPESTAEIAVDIRTHIDAHGFLVPAWTEGTKRPRPLQPIERERAERIMLKSITAAAPGLISAYLSPTDAFRGRKTECRPQAFENAIRNTTLAWADQQLALNTARELANVTHITYHEGAEAGEVYETCPVTSCQTRRGNYGWADSMPDDLHPMQVLGGSQPYALRVAAIHQNGQLVGRAIVQPDTLTYGPLYTSGDYSAAERALRRDGYTRDDFTHVSFLAIPADPENGDCYLDLYSENCNTSRCYEVRNEDGQILYFTTDPDATRPEGSTVHSSDSIRGELAHMTRGDEPSWMNANRTECHNCGCMFNYDDEGSTDGYGHEYCASCAEDLIYCEVNDELYPRDRMRRVKTARNTWIYVHKDHIEGC